MSSDVVRRANLASIVCDSRPQLPDGFRRSSARVGTQLGAARSGLSVYELPPGQAVSPYHYEHPAEEWLLVLKLPATGYQALADFLVRRHSYDEPEIVATPIVAGSDAYLSWITEETRPGRQA